MPILPQHQTPTSKQDCIDTWKANGRVTVPSITGNLVTVNIEHWIDCTAIDGKPLDAILKGRTAKTEPVREFGLLFADRLPEIDYPLPVLWVNQGEMNWLRSSV